MHPRNHPANSERQHRTLFHRYSLSSPYSSATLSDRRVAQSVRSEHDTMQCWQEEDQESERRRAQRRPMTDDTHGGVQPMSDSAFEDQHCPKGDQRQGSCWRPRFSEAKKNDGPYSAVGDHIFLRQKKMMDPTAFAALLRMWEGVLETALGLETLTFF
jgi:hypothetical protein